MNAGRIAICSIAALAVAVMSCGCNGGQKSWSELFRPRSPHEGAGGTEAATSWTPAAPVMQERQGSETRVRVVHLAFDVLRVDLPADGERHSPKVWNHVDVLRVGTETAARLARNGLRVGIASPESWPALEAIFGAAGATARHDQLLTQPGLPVTISLGALEATQTVFTYDRRNALVGKTFERGDRLIHLDYAYTPELGGTTELQVSFELRFDPGTLRWDRSGDTIRQVPDYERHMFEDLVTKATLRPGESLVIGPSAEATNEFLVGAAFLCGTQAGRRFETVLCINPRAGNVRSGE